MDSYIFVLGSTFLGLALGFETGSYYASNFVRCHAVRGLLVIRWVNSISEFSLSFSSAVRQGDPVIPLSCPVQSRRLPFPLLSEYTRKSTPPPRRRRRQVHR